MKKTINQITQGLWEHQAKDVQICAHRDHYALFHEMGAGKTATAINILRLWCMQKGERLSGIVFCPPVVIMQWQEQFHKWSKLGSYTVPLTGTGKKREKILRNHLDRGAKPIFITNYETVLMKPIQELLINNKLDFGIFDESHKLKNPTSKRSKAMVKIAKNMDKKLILTGTPVLNSPMDLFNQFLVLDNGRTFGGNFFVFRAKYFFDANAGMRGNQKYFPLWKPRKGIEDEFNKILDNTSSRVLKEDCLDLPPLVKQKMYVEMSAEQKRVYKELAKDLIATLKNGAVVADIVLVKLLRLQQIVSGFVSYEKEVSLGESHKFLKEDHFFEKTPRLALLEELLVDLTPQHKVIVWASFINNYKAIRDVCEKNEIGYQELRGGLTGKKRDEAITAFRSDPEVRVLIANQACGGTGLNLIEASYSIYYSKNFSYEQDSQSEARNHRGGSEIHSKVTRIDLVTKGTVDELILNALSRKEELSHKILDRVQDIVDICKH